MQKRINITGQVFGLFKLLSQIKLKERNHLIVTCEKCLRRFDDEYRWTMCPHNPIEASCDAGHAYGRPESGYCCRCDSFFCDHILALRLPKSNKKFFDVWNILLLVFFALIIVFLLFCFFTYQMREHISNERTLAHETFPV